MEARELRRECRQWELCGSRAEEIPPQSAVHAARARRVHIAVPVRARRGGPRKRWSAGTAPESSDARPPGRPPRRARCARARASQIAVVGRVFFGRLRGSHVADRRPTRAPLEILCGFLGPEGGRVVARASSSRESGHGPLRRDSAARRSPLLKPATMAGARSALRVPEGRIVLRGRGSTMLQCMLTRGTRTRNEHTSRTPSLASPPRRRRSRRPSP